jgi:hypothetical protein
MHEDPGKMAKGMVTKTVTILAILTNLAFLLQPT